MRTYDVARLHRWGALSDAAVLSLHFNPAVCSNNNMRSLLVFTLMGVMTSSYAGDPFDDDWANFKATYGKSYEGPWEEFLRENIYRENRIKILAHNIKYLQGKTSFIMALNPYSDMLASEVNSKMKGLRLSKKIEPAATSTKTDTSSLPATVDWRTKGIVTPVKNQGQCGSCWAFATTGSMEGAWAKKSGKLVSLSEQQLVDCSNGKWNDDGCGGGLMDNAFTYIKAVGGLESEKEYPYTATDDGNCSFNKTAVVATIKGFVDITKGDEGALQQAVATVGPVAVAINAGFDSFQHYGGGVYYEPICNWGLIDHGVLVVGYGTLNGADYWLVKNSWGEDWGVKGYIYMSRNQHNQCFIASMASYPTV